MTRRRLPRMSALPAVGLVQATGVIVPSSKRFARRRYEDSTEMPPVTMSSSTTRPAITHVRVDGD